MYCTVLYRSVLHSAVLYDTRTSGAYGPLVLAPTEGLGALQAPCQVGVILSFYPFAFLPFCLFVFLYSTVQYGTVQYITVTGEEDGVQSQSTDNSILGFLC